ncbi:MAG: SprT family zinc-dependent metalloprotease [Candidatus Saccharibacteria bacterium]|nr:SprT family zinc-dependent metalloprotease [Candidatus Saccharibacteria bacterium]
MTHQKTYPKIGTVTYYARKQKRIRLSFQDSSIRVSYPSRLGFKRAEVFVQSKIDWILEHKPNNNLIRDQIKIGQYHKLHLQDSCLNVGIFKRQIYAPKQNIELIEKLIKQALKIEAEILLKPLFNNLSQKLQLPATRLRIKYMKSQWGSCNHRGVISLNSALVYLPKRIIEAVIIHELCHLKFLNHSSDFWQLVIKHQPNHLALRQELKTYPIHLVITKKSSKNKN